MSSTRFRFTEVIVFPQIAKLVELKQVIAQRTNDMPIETVFPLLTAPSQIIAQWPLVSGRSHHVSTSRCFGEKFLRLHTFGFLRIRGGLAKSLE